MLVAISTALMMSSVLVTSTLRTHHRSDRQRHFLRPLEDQQRQLSLLLLPTDGRRRLQFLRLRRYYCTTSTEFHARTIGDGHCFQPVENTTQGLRPLRSTSTSAVPCRWAPPCPFLSTKLDNCHYLRASDSTAASYVRRAEITRSQQASDLPASRTLASRDVCTRSGAFDLLSSSHQLISKIVHGVPAMALHPLKTDFVGCDEFDKRFPKINVRNRFTLGVFSSRSFSISSTSHLESNSR